MHSNHQFKAHRLAWDGFFGTCDWSQRFSQSTGLSSRETHMESERNGTCPEGKPFSRVAVLAGILEQLDSENLLQLDQCIQKRSLWNFSTSPQLVSPPASSCIHGGISISSRFWTPLFNSLSVWNILSLHTVVSKNQAIPSSHPFLDWSFSIEKNKIQRAWGSRVDGAWSRARTASMASESPSRRLRFLWHPSLMLQESWQGPRLRMPRSVGEHHWKISRLGLGYANNELVRWDSKPSYK